MFQHTTFHLSTNFPLFQCSGLGVLEIKDQIHNSEKIFHSCAGGGGGLSLEIENPPRRYNSYS